MNTSLWILQILLGIYFTAVGVLHFIVPSGLPAPMSWMYELSDGLHYFSGTAEISAGLGLILPGLTKIQTRLTLFAGVGLSLLMIGAIVWHTQRGEFQNIGLNFVLGFVAAFIAYGRWKLHPLPSR